MSNAWTFESNSCGYMLFFNGSPQGGAGTRGTASHTSDGRVRHWKHRRADMTLYHDTATRICAANNAANIVPDAATLKGNK